MSQARQSAPLSCLNALVLRRLALVARGTQEAAQDRCSAPLIGLCLRLLPLLLSRRLVPSFGHVLVTWIKPAAPQRLSGSAASGPCSASCTRRRI